MKIKVFRDQAISYRIKKKLYEKTVLFRCNDFHQLYIPGTRIDETPFITKSFNNESVKRVIAETAGGSISVFSVASADVRVEVFIRPSNYKGNQILSKEEIQRRLDAEYNFILEASENTIKAVAKNKNRNMDWKKALTISYKIYVPKEISTNLTTSGGNITLRDLLGSQHFVTSGGNLEIERLKGKIYGVTSGGNIFVKDSEGYR